MCQTGISDNIGKRTFAVFGTAVALRKHSIVLFIRFIVRRRPTCIVSLVINITRVTEAQLFSGLNFSPCEYSQQRLFNIAFGDVTRDQSAVRIAGVVL